MASWTSWSHRSFICIARMAHHPDPADGKTARELPEGEPQLAVLHRLLCACLPPVSRPGMDPLGDSLLHVLGIGMHGDGHALRVRLRGKLGSASRTATSSIRLFVVSASNPERSSSAPPERTTYAQPPGPGLPRHPPSVQISISSLTLPPLLRAESPRRGFDRDASRTIVPWPTVTSIPPSFLPR